jgi:hypothetical protein
MKLDWKTSNYKVLAFDKIFPSLWCIINLEFIWLLFFFNLVIFSIFFNIIPSSQLQMENVSHFKYLHFKTFLMGYWKDQFEPCLQYEKKGLKLGLQLDFWVIGTTCNNYIKQTSPHMETCNFIKSTCNFMQTGATMLQLRCQT